MRRYTASSITECGRQRGRKSGELQRASLRARVVGRSSRVGRRRNGGSRSERGTAEAEDRAEGNVHRLLERNEWHLRREQRQVPSDQLGGGTPDLRQRGQGH